MIPFDVKNLGHDCDFLETWALQEELVEQRRAGKIRDTLLLLEHRPVYTIGRTRDHSSLGDDRLLPYPVIELNRGGQGTYHGPGQLIGYLILDLTAYRKDLHRHLRNLEEGLILALRDFGISAQRREGLTGVWIGQRKIASLGVGVRSWVTMHGFALNVMPESLSAFRAITPCGLEGVSMTCAATETGNLVTMELMKEAVRKSLASVFQRERSLPES